MEITSNTMFSEEWGSHLGSQFFKTTDKRARQSILRGCAGFNFFKAASFQEGMGAVRETEIYRKLDSSDAANSAGILLEDVQEMFELFRIDEDHKAGTVDMAVLETVMDEALNDPATRAGVCKALAAARIMMSQEVVDNRISAQSFHQVLLLGRPEDVAQMSLKLHGAEHGTTFVFRKNLVSYLVKKKDAHDNFKAMPSTFVMFCLIFHMVTSHLHVSTMLELNDAVSNGVKTSQIAAKFPDKFWWHLESFTSGPDVAHNNLIQGGVRVSRIAADGSPNGPLCQYSPWNFFTDEISTFGKRGNNPEPVEVCNKEVAGPSSWFHWPLKPEDALLRFNTGKTPSSLCQGLQAKADVSSSELSEYCSTFGGQSQHCKDLKSILSMNCSTAVAPESAGVELRPNWYVARAGTLQLEAVTFNSRLNFYVYNRMQITVHTSGAVTVVDLVESFDREPIWMDYEKDVEKGRQFSLFVDCLFFCIYLMSLISMLYHLVRAVFYKNFMKYAGDFWVQVELLNFFVIFMICIGYFHCVYLVSGLNQLTESLPAPASSTSSYRYSTGQWEDFIGKSMSEYEGQVHVLVDQASRIGQSFKDLRWYITVFSCCSCLRFLKVFRANEKLNVVMKTCLEAGSDLLHFLIVFISLCMSFVLVAHVLFGSQIVQFSDIGTSFNSIFVFLFGYLFDDVWGPMVEHGSHLAIIWTLLFMILMLLISLNMVLAIIFDVYADVKTAAAGEPNFLMQILNFFKEKKAKSDAKIRISFQRISHVRQSLSRRSVSPGNPQPQKNIENKARLQSIDEFTNLQSEAAPTSMSVFMNDQSANESASVSQEMSKGDRASLLSQVKTGLHRGTELVYDAAELIHREVDEALMEDDVLDGLEMRGVHPEDTVTAESLMDAMHYRNDKLGVLEELISAACENAVEEKEVQEFSLAKSLRLMYRIDANCRDLYTEQNPKTEQAIPEQAPEQAIPSCNLATLSSQVATTYQQMESLLRGELSHCGPGYSVLRGAVVAHDCTSLRPGKAKTDEASPGKAKKNQGNEAEAVDQQGTSSGSAFDILAEAGAVEQKARAEADKAAEEAALKAVADGGVPWFDAMAELGAATKAKEEAIKEKEEAAAAKAQAEVEQEKARLAREAAAKAMSHYEAASKRALEVEARAKLVIEAAATVKGHAVVERAVAEATAAAEAAAKPAEEKSVSVAATDAIAIAKATDPVAGAIAKARGNAQVKENTQASSSSAAAAAAPAAVEHFSSRSEFMAWASSTPEEAAAVVPEETVIEAKTEEKAQEEIDIPDDAETNAAATKLQAIQRGKLSRRQTAEKVYQFSGKWVRQVEQKATKEASAEVDAEQQTREELQDMRAAAVAKAEAAGAKAKAAGTTEEALSDEEV